MLRQPRSAYENRRSPVASAPCACNGPPKHFSYLAILAILGGHACVGFDPSWTGLEGFKHGGLQTCAISDYLSLPLVVSEWTQVLRKVKSVHDEEAKVIGHEASLAVKTPAIEKTWVPHQCECKPEEHGVSGQGSNTHTRAYWVKITHALLLHCQMNAVDCAKI
eukprot:860996-Amphidinium_carterae.1